MSNINNVLWAQQLDGTLPDTGISIAADGSGNTYVTGAFNGTATFGNTTLTSTSFGYSDVFVAKLDSNKNVLWAEKLGGTLTDFGLGITVDRAGNSYATGYFSGTATFGSTTLTSTGNEDGFITKLDSNGNVLWAQKLGSTSSGSGIGITTDAIGNIYATGALNANLDINNSTSLSTSDTFIRKLDRNGNILWTKNLGGISPDSGFGITNDKDGNTYVSGFFSGTATFDNITLTSVGNNDAFITKLDSSGNFLWAKNLGGTSDDSGRGIIVDETGNAYFTGYFSDNATFGTTTFSSAGNTDVFVTKLDNNGNTVWAKNLGGTESDEGYGIVADEVGNIYVSGIFSGTATFASTTLTSAGDSDAFIAKLDSNGNVLSAQKFGGVSTDLGTGIATDGKGNIYGMGGFSDTATFGNITLTSAGSIDAFVVKLGDEVEEPKITLALTPNSVAEDGGNNLIYTFTRDGDTTNPLTVNFNIGGNATYNTDYTIVGTDTFTGFNGTVAFKAGDTTATVTINPTADTTF
ncbi:MAG: SBBP repeat-containing protein, partial [Nostoc sp. EkiNYC01]|nr:SBBP repeat-containing protein [Nostoc sp. EkiNYC01]